MELVLTKVDLEPLPKHNEDLIIEPSGFLTSEYKAVVNENYTKKDTTSIFSIKQRIKSRNYRTCCNAEIALKLSIFLTIILLIFN
ncbi:hypothetical protein SAMN05428642_103289 [Flaviramulus basaltis]|uniref:Uncharacterized protein n=1 Tax=Flaviramulus basaltis TaxID=369401 RepID=A0A1K2IN32_9FLAO|nr:hypothetical protein [Flaviramulus basaltis]SFZ93710.1 hypothetical protein SAMN05428642_103289 [Flaviramulus basaltis]